MWTHCCPAGVSVTSALLLFIFYSVAWYQPAAAMTLGGRPTTCCVSHAAIYHVGVALFSTADAVGFMTPPEASLRLDTLKATAETYVEDSGRVPLTLGGHRWRSLCLQTVRFPV